MNKPTENINKYTIAFYNLENLFDTENDPKKMDDGYTRNGDLQWTIKRLNQKTLQLGKTISQLGYEETGFPPILVGVAEVENKIVLDELVQSEFLKNKDYGYIHFDSPDERGIDTALLYRKEYFKILHSEAFTLIVNNPNDERDTTRDILYVKGKISEHIIHILVNHWPSRHDGPETTNYKRVVAANRNREIIEKIKKENSNAKIVVMGDFNDNPHNESPTLLAGTDFFNPMKTLLTNIGGSLSHNNAWNLFDQILVSNNFLKAESDTLYYQTSKIYNFSELEEHHGKYQGNPLKTFAGTKYLGGNSDHFPVFSIFSIKKDV